jgi:peptidoglycan/xylan/chitin deacetylase (PgdA/CDA1 family)
MNRNTNESNGWNWPATVEAAVSFTYDDGNLNNLEHAIPDLEAEGFCGSFYLPTGSQTVREQAAAWRSALGRGHEVGNHSVRHPARLDGYPGRSDWIKHPLEEYTPEAIQKEIDESARWLDEHIGIDPDRSYAYPCGHTAIGSPPNEKAYLRAVRSHHRFARGFAFGRRDDSVANANARPYGINDPMSVDLLKVEGIGSHPFDLEYCKGLVDLALESGGWLVFVFHGVAGPSHEVSSADHQQLLKRCNQPGIWVAPFHQIARHIEQHQKKAKYVR